jgi:hypothetical protein
MLVISMPIGSAAVVTGVNRACSARLVSEVIDTTTFIWGSDAYFPIPVSLLSPAGTSGTVIFAFRPGWLPYRWCQSRGLSFRHGR